MNIQYLEKFHVLQNVCPILLERSKIEKIEKLEANLHGKSYTHKKVLNHGLVLKTFHRVQNVWLKPNIDMNIDLRKQRKSWLEKDLRNKLLKNAAFGKTIINLKTRVPLLQENEEGAI